MKKSEATELFGGIGKMAAALGLTRQAIHSWKPELTEQQADRVIGAGIRLGVTALDKTEQMIIARRYTGKPAKVR